MCDAVRAIDPSLLDTVCGGVRLPAWSKVGAKQLIEGVLAGTAVGAIAHYMNKMWPSTPAPAPAPAPQK